MGNESSQTATSATRQASSARGPRSSSASVSMGGGGGGTPSGRPATSGRRGTTARKASEAPLRNNAHCDECSNTDVVALLLDGQSTSSRTRAGRLSEASGGMATNTLADTLHISVYQCQTISATWTKFHMSANGVYVEMFKALGRQNANARELLQKASIMEGFQQCSASSSGNGSTTVSQTESSRRICDLKEHGRLLTELVDFAVRHLDQPVKVTTDRCIDIGAGHTPLDGQGFAPEMWDQLGDCLMEVMTLRCDAVRRQRDAAKAWLPLISFLIGQMRVGYTADRRKTQPNTVR